MDLIKKPTMDILIVVFLICLLSLLLRLLTILLYSFVPRFPPKEIYLKSPKINWKWPPVYLWCCCSFTKHRFVYSTLGANLCVQASDTAQLLKLKWVEWVSNLLPSDWISDVITTMPLPHSYKSSSARVNLITFYFDVHGSLLVTWIY